MKKLFLAAAVLLGMFSASGQGQLKSFTMSSSILGVEKEFSVYLPAGYDESNGSYPVLYLLHGAGGTHKTWQTSGNMKRITDDAIAGGTVLPMVIVMPDARGQGVDKQINKGPNMGYFNMPGWNYEDFFFEEFIPHIEANFRVIADKKHRAIAGLSMGGGGAAVYAQRHPEYFSSSCALSGLLGINEDEYLRRRLSDNYHNTFVESAYRTSAVAFLQNAGRQQLDSLKTVRWYVDCGDDDYLYWGNIMFYSLMREKNIPLQYRMRDGGHHWTYWSSALPTVLSFVSVGFIQ